MLTYKKGVKDGLPIGLGYLAVSFAFGVSVVGQGLNKFIAVIMSALNLTSAGQFAGANVIISAGALLGFSTLLELILTQIVINARYFLMSITLSQRLSGKWRLIDRLLCSFGITDEIFAVAVSQKDGVNKNYFLGLMLLPFIGWTFGTFLGAFAGDILPEIITKSLTIALYAMFIAIIVPEGIKNSKVFIVALISLALSCLFFYVKAFNVIGEGFKYIICALVASVLGAVFFPINQEEDEQNG